MINGLTHLCITKMDVMDAFEEIQICTAYEVDGKRTEQFPSQLSRLEKVKPVWETLPGWKSPTAGITKWQDLPGNAYLPWVVGSVSFAVLSATVLSQWWPATPRRATAAAEASAAPASPVS